MGPSYESDAVRRYYDEYGEREWARLERRPMDRVSLAIHRRLLSRMVKRGDRVLEVGAGPGRFTIQLAQLGARIAVTDVSPRQLELNRERVTGAGLEAAIVGREVADVVDLSEFDDGEFDVVTALGGPLSYVFDLAGVGLDQMLRKLRPDGVLAFSVMSRWGAIRMALADVLDTEYQGRSEENSALFETGDLAARVPGMSFPHECHLFTWDEVEALLKARPCSIVEATATNYLSVNLGDLLQDLDESRWERVVDWEQQICSSSGVLDAGTHILVAARRK